MECYYAVPVTNLILDHPFKIGEYYVMPPVAMYEEFKDYDCMTVDTITKEEHVKMLRIIKNIYKNHAYIGSNAHIIFKDKYLLIENIQESFQVVNKIADKANRALDYLRIDQCEVGNFEQLPGIAGILNDGIKGVFQLEFKTEGSLETRLLSGRVTIMIKDGLGLYPSCEFPKSDYQNMLYKSFFDNRDSLIFSTCKNALHRVADSFYMNNFNIAFIYLMSTLEMLADPDKYIGFQTVKSKILPFIAKNKSSYHMMSNELKNISMNLRTDVVHNEKSLYDIYNSEAEIISLLNKIISIIIRYVFEINQLDIANYEQLDVLRKQKISELGLS